MFLHTLIHCALLCEAQTLINFLKLKQDNSVQNLPKHSKLFINANTILIVAGIGKENTSNALNFIFSNYKIKKAFNIGIAGCSNKNIAIGEVFCTNRTLEPEYDIKTESITTLNTVCSDLTSIKTTLVDMESEYFIEKCKENIKDIYVLKVVSDYCECKIPKKSFVTSLIQNSFSKWKDLL